MGASLVEMHSHIGPWPAGFSYADRLGLQETVPHMWWRLKKRPYLALVVTNCSFDAGEGGRFRITRLPSGNRRLVIRHPDWMVAEHIVASGSHDVRITVRSGVTLRGRVVDASRQPVPRASVIVDRWLERGFDPSYKTGAHVTTDEEGLFRAEHVTPGRFQLKVEAEGFPPLETNAIEVRTSAERSAGNGEFYVNPW